MKLAEQETLLHQGGFSQKEIADWKKEKIQKLNNAGFNNQEILESFGSTSNDKKVYQDYFSEIKNEIVNEYQDNEIISPEDEFVFTSMQEVENQKSLKEIKFFL